MIVEYVGTGPLSPDRLALEYATVGRDIFEVERGQAIWLPDSYPSIDPETGVDVFRELGIKVLEEPAPLRPSAFARARDGDSLLVTRQYGGFGDILIQTMIWPNLRRQFPNSRITYALPIQYHQLLEGNPYLDDVTNLHVVTKRRFDHASDISKICGEVEQLTRPCTKHRADIWGEHLGVVMETHEGFYQVHHHEREWAARYVEALRPRPVVAIVPYAADKRKDLPDDTIQAVIDGLVLDLGAEVCVLHDAPTSFRRAHSLHELTFRWLGAFLTEADLVISVDTGTLHLAAILRRPVLAIYGSEDGRVFTKYYATVRLLQPFRLECQPCWYLTPCMAHEVPNRRPGDCMFDLKPDEILAIAAGMLRESRA